MDDFLVHGHGRLPYQEAKMAYLGGRDVSWPEELQFGLDDAHFNGEPDEIVFARYESAGFGSYGGGFDEPQHMQVALMNSNHPGGQSQSAVQEYAQDMNMWARESLDEFENIWNQQQEVDEQMSLAYQETKQDWQLQRVKKKESRKRRIDDNHTQMMLSMKEHEEDQAKERAATIAHRQETEKAQRLAFAKLEETKQTRKATARAEAEGENNRRLAKLRAQNEQAEKELETVLLISKGFRDAETAANYKRLHDAQGRNDRNEQQGPSSGYDLGLMAKWSQVKNTPSKYSTGHSVGPLTPQGIAARFNQMSIAEGPSTRKLLPPPSQVQVQVQVPEKKKKKAITLPKGEDGIGKGKQPSHTGAGC